MKEVDYIIVGQGLAGTCMAFRLLERGRRVMILDEESEVTASSISSGIINPITGRRYVKSWMIDSLIPEAVSFYLNLGKILEDTFIESKRVLRGLANILEENLWLGQSSKQDYASYFGELIDDRSYTRHFKNDLKLGEVLQSYQVHVHRMIKKSRAYFKAKGCYLNEHVIVEDFTFEKGVVYQSIRAKSVIFCEGWKVIKNPYFSDLPFDPTKGEVFICDLPEYDNVDIIKNQKFILPWQNDSFWIGSTNQNAATDDQSSPEKQQELEQFLKNYIVSDYKIKQKITAVRPSTKQRRPIIGCHPNIPNAVLFNGLGTKGASLAPYFSRQLVDHLIEGKSILKEVSISKFYN